jgi:hypothetical protein
MCIRRRARVKALRAAASAGPIWGRLILASNIQPENARRIITEALARPPDLIQEVHYPCQKYVDVIARLLGIAATSHAAYIRSRLCN